MRDDTRSGDGDAGAAPPDLPAGGFSAWLRDTRTAQREGGSADVPCGDCIGCCTSSYFIHVGPDETETLSRIPAALLFPAPGLPKGHLLLGYDAQGHCPMLVDGRCSIYVHRPQTCRSYDCRIFAATGVAAGGEDKLQIHERVRRWRFSQPGVSDPIEQAAVRAAAAFLREHATELPEGLVPSHPTQLALLAIKIYDVFVTRTQDSGSRTVREIADAIVERSHCFDEARPGSRARR